MSRPPTVCSQHSARPKRVFIEALTAIYEVAALPLFDKALARGERKLSRIVPLERQERIAYSQGEALPFFNINYPADLELVRRLLAAL